jgi:integrase
LGRRHFGNIKKLPSGNYLARYLDNSGQRRSAPDTFGTKLDAQRWLSDIETQLQRGMWTDPKAGRMNVATWLAQYRLSGAHLNKRATTRARDDNVIDAHILPALGSRRLASLSPRDIQDFVDGLSAKGLQPATIRTDFGVLRALLNAAVRAELLPRSPCRAISIPRAHPARNVRFLEIEQVHALASAMPEEYRCMVYLAACLGLRWSEVAGLRIGALELLEHRLRIEATLAEVAGHVAIADVKSRASRRVLTIPPFIIELLASHLAAQNVTGADSDALVFTAPGGGPLRAANFRRRVWQPAVAAAGLAGTGVNFHHLRHTAVGFLVAANTSSIAIQQRMGHKSFRTTADVYGHVLHHTDSETDAALDRMLRSGQSVDPMTPASLAPEANGPQRTARPPQAPVAL